MKTETETKERPILFSGPMVRALLEGRKTQTRRAVKFLKLHADHGEPRPGDAWVDHSYETPSLGGVPCLKVPYGSGEDETVHRHFPVWSPGERLWVKETHMFYPQAGKDCAPGLVYRADGKVTDEMVKLLGKQWRPSIFCRREYSRLTLEVKGVRVERVQDISEGDAWAEGCKRGLPTDNGGYFPAEEPDPSGKGARGWDNAREWYADLWEEINGPGTWEANPWVWVVEFGVISTGGGVG